MRPYRHFIAASGRQLFQLRAIGQHRPNLRGAAARRTKRDVQTVRTPNRVHVPACAMRQLRQLAFCDFHHEYIKISWLKATIPTHGHDLATGVPRRVRRLPTAIRQALDVRAVHIHSIDLSLPRST